MPRPLPILYVSVLATLACGGTKQPAEDPSSSGDHDARSGPAEVGHPAPDLTIQTMNGKGTMAIDQFAGKLVVVDFWATWCEPCKKSFPAREGISKRHEGKVQIVGVNVNDEPDGVVDFAKGLGTTFPIGWDKGHSIAERWKVGTMPTSYVVDASGTVRYVHAGYREGDDVTLEGELESLLSKTDKTEKPRAKPAPPAPTPAASAADGPAAASSPPADEVKPAKPVKKKKKKTKKPKAPAS
jgi:thiol-disulfide isomerase/thioredoxin